MRICLLKQVFLNFLQPFRVKILSTFNDLRAPKPNKQENGDPEVLLRRPRLYVQVTGHLLSQTKAHLFKIPRRQEVPL